MRISIFSLIITTLLLASVISGAQVPLERRPFIGLDMAPLSIELKGQLGLDNSIYGVFVKGTLPESPAEKAGLKKNDVIVSFNGNRVTSSQELLEYLREVNNRSTAEFGLIRHGRDKKLKVKLIPFPKEEDHRFITEYTAVKNGGNTHRVLITRPRVSEKLPGILLIQGVGCFSQDNMSYPMIRHVVDSLTLSGYVVMRVEKSGIGDSRGKPCNETNLEDEVGGYLEGVKLLKSMEYVDSSNVFGVGFSIGGIIAPILNLQTPLKGIIAYGTVGRNWFEYEIENTRRQFFLSGQPLDSLDSFMRKEYNRIYGLFVSLASPTDIIERYPWTADNLFIYPMSFSYFQQVSMIDISSLWLGTDCPVLAIHGSADFVSSAEDHQQIADLVNSKSPGMATYLEMEGIDHWLDRADSFKRSYNKTGSDFNPEIIQVIRNWVRNISGK